MRRAMITTIDNPYDPFTQPDLWLMFDIDHKYSTPEKLARFSIDSSALSDSEIEALNELAIDRMIEVDPLKMYKKVVQED